MSTSTSSTSRRRPKASTYVVLVVAGVAALIAVASMLGTGDLTAVFQGIENAFDGRQGRGF
ncbi:hypothetical protein ACDF64_16665 [Agromyces sp. MMS24-JH15]|uniref:hypothetical protein n=1 Tax=Agromyces sp. MMS24-JH15 TaxID=3243765 RepID=UPI003748C0FF